MRVDLSCPIELWEYALPTEENSACSFTFFNLDQRAISSIQITLTFFGKEDDVLSRRVERPMALDAKGREPFVVEISAEGLAVEAIDLTIDKAWFEDGSDWRRSQEARLVEYEPNELPPSRRLEQLRYVAGQDAAGFPNLQEHAWMCVCGRVNGLDELTCRRCGRDREHVFEHFNAEAVQEVIDRREQELEEKARQAREEASRQEFIRQDRARRKRRARRMRTAVVCAVVVVGVTAYLFAVLGLPELKYQTARAALSSGDIAGARVGFESLLDYRDAADQVKQCDLLLAQQYAQSGELELVEEALAILETLGAYPGATEAIAEATYQKGALLVDDGAYDEASEVLAGISGYRDADTLRKEAEYQIATREMTSGDYEAAAERFAALGNYLDAAAQAKECVYRPATALMAEGRYDEAAEMFATITGYSDANHQRLECLYQSALRALNEGNYEYAAERFLLLGNFEDADEQYQRAVYLTANTNRDAGRYDTARSLYASISTYEDAAEQVKACSYLPAVALMTEGKYEEAAALLRAVPGYLDADTLYLQCIYLPAVAAMEAENYDEAIELFSSIPDYSDAAELLNEAYYGRAAQLEASGDLEGAIEAFEAMGDYEDAEARALAARYALAQEAFDAGDFDLAAERFGALGNYEDAEDRVLECAYEKALLPLEEDDLQGAYDALTAIEDYAPAEEKALEVAYAMGEAHHAAGELESAAEAFALAGDYEDAEERQRECVYEQALNLRDEGAYQEASELFDSLGNYTDARERRDECYDLWLAEIAAEAETLYEAGDYAAVIDLMQDQDIEALPNAYESLRTMYYDSNLKVARQLIDEDRALDAYGYLIACNGYQNADTLLDKNIYKILGTWETSAGVRYGFYLNGTCIIAGEQMYFNMFNPYGISTGTSQDDLTRTLSYSSGGEETMTLREDATEKLIRLTRLRPPELSPTDDEPGDSVANTEVGVSTDDIGE